MAQQNPFTMDWSSFLEPVTIGSNLELLRSTTTIDVYTQPENNSDDNDDENSDDDDEEDDTQDRLCSICQQNYQNGQVIRRINHCHHFYHQPCLDEWLENNTKCPECNHDLRDGLPRNRRTNPSRNTNTSNNTIGPQRRTSERESDDPDDFGTILRELFQNRPHNTPNNPSGSSNSPLNGIIQGFLDRIQQEPGDGVINIEYHRQGQPPMVMNATSSRVPLSQSTQMPHLARSQRPLFPRNPTIPTSTASDNPQRSTIPHPVNRSPGQPNNLWSQGHSIGNQTSALHTGTRMDRLEYQLANLTRLIENQQTQNSPQNPSQNLSHNTSHNTSQNLSQNTSQNLSQNSNSNNIESHDHVINELPQNDFSEVDLTTGIFSLRNERPQRSGKKSHKKNKNKSKPKWKFWK